LRVVESLDLDVSTLGEGPQGDEESFELRADDGIGQGQCAGFDGAEAELEISLGVDVSLEGDGPDGLDGLVACGGHDA